MAASGSQVERERRALFHEGGGQVIATNLRRSGGVEGKASELRRWTGR